jgi:hypothetical protein
MLGSDTRVERGRVNVLRGNCCEGQLMDGYIEAVKVGMERQPY